MNPDFTISKIMEYSIKISLLVLTAAALFPSTRKMNFQSFKCLSYVINIANLLLILMIGVVTLYGVFIADWPNDSDYKKGTIMLRQKYKNFLPPEFCIVSSLSTGFCFQYFFFQVLTTMNQPKLDEES